MSGDNQQATGWLSGLIDTDGTISLRFGHRGTMHPFISIPNTNPQVIETAVAVIHSLGVGCHVSWRDNRQQSAIKGKRALGMIQIVGQKRVAALLPHLTLFAKHWRAERVLEYIQSRQSRPKRSPYSDHEQAIKAQLNSQWEPQRLHAMPSDYSWLAGVVDGDGWLGITNGSLYKGSVRQYPNLTITDSSRLLMDALAHMMPNHRLTTRHNKVPLYQFVLANYKRAIPVIEAILPYLVGKRQQADLICELYRYRQTLPYRTPYGEYEMELKRKVQALNAFAEVMI